MLIVGCLSTTLNLRPLTKQLGGRLAVVQPFNISAVGGSSVERLPSHLLSYSLTAIKKWKGK